MAETWDKIVDTAKDFAGTVAEAAGDLYGKGKDYLHLKKLEYKLREKYRLLGRIQFKIETEDGAASGDKEDVIKDIIELRKEIEQNNGKDQHFEDIICEDCGSVIPGDARFCPGCGVKL